MAGKLETLEDVILAYLKLCAKDNRRPQMNDETYQRIFASELAGRIRKWNGGA